MEQTHLEQDAHSVVKQMTLAEFILIQHSGIVLNPMTSFKIVMTNMIKLTHKYVFVKQTYVTMTAMIHAILAMFISLERISYSFFYF